MVRSLPIVLAFCAVFIPFAVSQCTIENAEKLFRRSIYEFSLSLVTRVAQTTENHFVMSPLSVWTLISTTSLAADGPTFDEIKRVLKLHSHNCFNKKYFEIVRKITTSTDSVTLDRSSNIFIDDTMPLNEGFRRQVQRIGACEVKKISFRNFDSAAAIINDYIENATRGLIYNVVTPSDIEQAYLILIDALYFKGLWKIPFPDSDTERSSFYDERRNLIGDVDLMFVSGRFNLAYIDQIKARVLELPYGDDRFSFLVFLPQEDSSVTALVDNLITISISSILSVFKGREPDTVFVQIPKFRISSELNDLKELLMDMGLVNMFNTNAQFPSLSDYSLYVSTLIQKAEIHVNERGTEASAATEAVFEGRIAPEQFTANRPFLFMIVDKQTEAVLFIGAYSKPSTVDIGD